MTISGYGATPRGASRGFVRVLPLFLWWVDGWTDQAASQAVTAGKPAEDDPAGGDFETYASGLFFRH